MLSSISIFHLLEKLKKKTKLSFFALHSMPHRQHIPLASCDPQTRFLQNYKQAAGTAQLGMFSKSGCPN